MMIDGENQLEPLAPLLREVEQEAGPEAVAEIKEYVTGSKQPELAAELTDEAPEKAPQPEKKEGGGDIRSALSKLSKAEKLKTAMFGNAVVRRLLICDPSRMIQEAVLANPRLTMPEVEDFAKNTSVDSQVLRAIAGKSVWMRVYKVKANLILNPKCPADLSLKWLKYLQTNEIKTIARSKNVPQVLQTAAKKILNNV